MKNSSRELLSLQKYRRFTFDGVKFPANNDTDKFEELNQNVSVNMFEVDDENEQTVISRKIKKIRC